MTPADCERPLVIAHRGASGYLPEHSLAAKALAHGMGADYLEQDVVLTRDGVPVVLHDIYLQSTTDVEQVFPDRAREDGQYYAADFSLEEIRRLRLHERSTSSPEGSHAVYPQRYPLQATPFTVPTLAEEVDLVQGLNRSRGGRAGLYIELKAPRWHLQQGLDITAAVMALLREKQLDRRPARVFLQCFDDRTLLRLKEEFKTDLPLIQLIGENDWGEDGAVDYEAMRRPEGLARVATYATGIGPWLGQIFLGLDAAGEPRLSSLVEDARAQGLVVHPYTFRVEEVPEGMGDFERWLDLFIQRVGVDGLFTDFPDRARAYIDQRVDC